MNFRTFAFAFGLISLPAFSQDLLVNSIPDNAVPDNKEYFYNWWSACKADGNVLGWENAPTSYFTTVKPGFQITTINTSYDHITIGGGEGQGFSVGDPVMVLDYENNNGLCYSFPITVPETATYHLSGAIKVLHSGVKPSDPVVPNSISVFVAESTRGNKTFKVVSENGKNRLKVEDANGNEYPNVWKLTPNSIDDNVTPISTEEGKIVLTPDLKYFSIYCPTNMMLVSKLSLTKEGIPGAVNEIGVEEIGNAVTEWFDLSGNRITEPSAPGIYISRRGSDIRKIIVR